MSSSFSKITPWFGKVIDGTNSVNGFRASLTTTDKGYILDLKTLEIPPLEFLFLEENSIPKELITNYEVPNRPEDYNTGGITTPIIREQRNRNPVTNEFMNVRLIIKDLLDTSNKYAYTHPPNSNRYIVAIRLTYGGDRKEGNADFFGHCRVSLIDNFGMKYDCDYTIPDFGIPTSPWTSIKGELKHNVMYLLYNKSTFESPLSDGAISVLKSSPSLFGQLTDNLLHTNITPTVSSSSNSNGEKTEQEEEAYKDRVALTIQQQHQHQLRSSSDPTAGGYRKRKYTRRRSVKRSR
jgi:hypothetical protein